MDVSFVVAMSRDRVIGRRGELPWRLPRDLKHFRELTWGKPIVMGRKTHESLGRPLPGRTNIILTHRPGFAAPGCVVVGSIDEALDQARATDADEVMIVGGGEVYRDVLPLCSKVHLTLVEGDFEGDTFFPVDLLGSADWRTVREERWEADERNPYDARYLVLTRARSLMDQEPRS
ncbi:MAG: dihydrofolate reductase [Paludisphaera borealis]|uniref:dihydrofolate reductase n=1 Tax=Paludisphaera borealis TaxID=1387353 RepID=UPI00284F6DE1|nr:dihydrofolate reductase [Paludisphaera borealis]MDR3618854.1 dihydrofolate reductase [Paludisphaera borealis]